MLTHGNLLHQIIHLGEVVPAIAGKRFLSLLLPWYLYERAAEYFTFTRGIEQVYTNVNYLKEDVKNFPPHYLVAVPLVYEILYSGIQKQLLAGSGANISMEYKRIYEGKSLAKVKQRQSMLIVASRMELS